MDNGRNGPADISTKPARSNLSRSPGAKVYSSKLLMLFVLEPILKEFDSFLHFSGCFCPCSANKCSSCEIKCISLFLVVGGYKLVQVSFSNHWLALSQSSCPSVHYSLQFLCRDNFSRSQSTSQGVCCICIPVICILC